MSTTPIFASSFFLTGSILAASACVPSEALNLPTGCRASRFVARPAASATLRRIRAAQ
ncbi:hypothetical protein RCH14_002025 [Massilia sp. MP_M2]